ncbi:MAG TPA: PadR family transcriptional regulator [Solirubrobacterales bacterium]|nr:PadR family transcriptional regulator [Solirubrobacterales bacterium]
MKARSSSFFILGMLRLGATSGYAIKKATDVSMRYFWPTSLAQVYPELGRLEQEGMVVRRDDSRGNRSRAAYEVSEEGQAAMLDWLRNSDEKPLRVRDEGMLRLYFADALPLADAIGLVRRLRARSAETGSELRDEVLPLAEAFAKASGIRFPAITARFGADLHAFTEEWFANLERELSNEDGHPSHSGASNP